MPLLKFDLIEGRSKEQLSSLLDAAHRAVLAAFKVPERDRYQVVTEHKPEQLRIEDTGLGFTRTNELVVVTVLTSPRSAESKQAFYKILAQELKQACSLRAEDLVISVVTNEKGDWSFGMGEAQYITGAL